MGRTGYTFAFEKYKVTPDILCLAKAFGGGMPLGAFISSQKNTMALSSNPVLGHITTFGGHPMACAAGLAAFEQVKNISYSSIQKKSNLFKKLLRHTKIKEVRGEGLLLAVQFDGERLNKEIISYCIGKGLITDWFLFNASAMRVAPPLTISEKEIKTACEIILDGLSGLK